MRYLIEETISITYALVVEADSEDEACEIAKDVDYSERFDYDSSYISYSCREVEPDEDIGCIPVV